MWVVHDTSSPNLDAHDSGAVWQPARGGVYRLVEHQGSKFSNRSVARGDAAGFAELRFDFHTEISQLTRRVERLEEQRSLVRP
jgi:hypothetical protein